jgi:lipopolysaccharide export system permease protein
MMILDRYLLRQFVQIFVICFLSLTGLYVVIDLFGHLDHFSAHAAEHGDLLGTIIQYYGYQSLSFFDRTSGMLAMIAAMFTITWLERHQELTAMLAAGISKFRVIKPLLIAAVVVSLLGVANREFVIPSVRAELTRDTKNLGGNQTRDLESRYDGRTDILIGGEKMVAAEQRILKPNFILPASLDRYGKQLVAENGYCLAATAEHPSGYLLDGVTAPRKIDRLASLTLDGEPVVITPQDASWLEPGQAFVVSQVRFQLLAGGSTWRTYASTGELIAELGSPSTDLGADVRVAVHSRLLQPLMDGTLLMLGLPLMFSRRNRNMFLSFGICLLVAVAFTLVTLACQSLGGLNLLRPTLAAWLPILVFLPIAVAMSHSLRT